MNRFNRQGFRKALLFGGVLLALLAVGIGTAFSRAGAQEVFTNRATLTKDVIKLAIVVMANQTPITQADATAILPKLLAIKAEDVISETQAAQLDAQLHSAFSPVIESAVSVVRLPELKPKVKNRLQQLAARRGYRNPAKYGPASRAFDRLLEFFQQTATAK